MRYSNQQFFCRTCGIEMFCPTGANYGAEVCSSKCWNELKWRETLSIMNKEYYPDPRELCELHGRNKCTYRECNNDK